MCIHRPYSIAYVGYTIHGGPWSRPILQVAVSNFIALYTAFTQWKQFCKQFNGTMSKLSRMHVLALRSSGGLWPVHVWTSYRHHRDGLSHWGPTPCARGQEGSTQYLLDQLQYVADLPTRRRGRLRSSTSSLLDVFPSRCVTVGDRSLATADPRLGTVYLRPVCLVTHNISSKAENSFISAIIPRHCVITAPP